MQKGFSCERESASSTKVSSPLRLTKCVQTSNMQKAQLEQLNALRAQVAQIEADLGEGSMTATARRVSPWLAD